MKKRHLSLRRCAALLLAAALCIPLAGCGGGKGTVPAAAVQTVSGSITERIGSAPDRSLHRLYPDALKVPMASSGLMEIYLDDKTFGIALYEKTKEKYWYSLPMQPGAHYDDSAATVTLDVLYGNTLYKLNSQDDCVQYRNVACDTLGDTSPYGFFVTYVLTADAATAAKIDNGRIFAGDITSADFARSDIAYMVRVTYELIDGNLYVSATWKNLSENPDAVLCDLSLLPFFGASASGKTGDFFLIPDGCGAMIHTDKNDPSFSPIDLRVYGDNPAAGKGEASIPALFPAYAARQDDSAFAVIIEQGDAIASLHAERASGAHGYNTVSPSFCITEKTTVQKNGRDVTLLSKNPYAGEIKLCVRLLAGANASLDGIAAACREQFMRTGYLSVDTVENEEYLPFQLNILATRSEYGFLRSSRTLTTFEQAEDMLSRMKAKGVNNIDVRCIGALRGGPDTTRLGSLRTAYGLGGKRGLNALTEYAAAQGHSLYLDTPVLTFRNSVRSASNALDIESSDMLADTVVANQDYSRSTARLTRTENTVLSLLTDAQTVDFDGFCVSDAGRLLYSDYAEQYTDRQQAMALLQSQLPALSANRLFMVDNGNFYAIRYADVISGLPFAPALTERAQLYTGVPLAQMILHGTVDYSGTSVNFAADPVTARMRSVEFGCCPGYTWCFDADGGDLLCYENQLNDAVEYYLQANAVLADLRDARIVDNGMTKTAGVRYTQYDNGAIVYVNYSDKEASVGNIRIDPLSFARIG